MRTIDSKRLRSGYGLLAASVEENANAGITTTVGTVIN